MIWSASFCESAFNTAAGAGLGGNVANCNAPGELIGDEALVANFLYPNYLPAWKGQPYFPVGPTYEETDGMGNSATLECGRIPATGFGSKQVCEKTQCSEPLVMRRLPVFVDPATDLNLKNASNVDYCNSTEDCTNCTDACVVSCPNPLLFNETAGEYTTQWLLVWVPGIVALPFVLVIVFSETVKLAGMKKKNITDRYLQLAGLFCLAHILTDSIPSMVLRNDMRCDGHDTYSQQLNMHGSKAQYVGRIKPNLLQALMFTVVLTLYKVRCQLQASIKMQKYTPGPALKSMTLLLVFLVPGACYAANLLITNNPWADTSSNYRQANNMPFVFPSLYIPNDIRYQYTSGPKFETVNQEYFWVQAPLMIAGACSVVLSAQLLCTVYKMHASSSAKSDKGSTSATKKLAWNMLRFSFAVIICVLLNLIATVSYLPNALDFGLALNEFKRCAMSGIPSAMFNRTSNKVNDGLKLADVVFTEKDLDSVVRKCGFNKNQAPSQGLICLLLISQSLPDLLFGIVFAMPAIKQLTVKVGKLTSKVGATSANSSSNDE